MNIIEPRDGWPNERAIATSAGALNNSNFKVEVIDTLDGAIKETSYVISTTARERDINKPVLSASEGINNVLKYFFCLNRFYFIKGVVRKILN